MNRLVEIVRYAGRRSSDGSAQRTGDDRNREDWAARHAPGRAERGADDEHAAGSTNRTRDNREPRPALTTLHHFLRAALRASLNGEHQ